MVESDNIHLGRESIARLHRGVEKVVSVVRGSYGAAGGNIIVEATLPPFHIMTNDGKLSIDNIRLADPVENIGANISKEVGDKADMDSGDGRKTTMILFEEILKGARDSKLSPNELRRQLNACVPAIIASLDTQKRPIEIKDVRSVATISSESDALGELFQQIYDVIGKDGFVEIDNSGLSDSYFEIVDGVRFRGARAFGTYSYTEDAKAVFSNAHVLVVKDKISDIEQLTPIVKALQAEGKSELVIYCDEIDMGVASRMAMVHKSGGFKTLIIKSPRLWKDWLFEDFAKVTGATIVDGANGITLKSVRMSHLGSAAKVVSDDQETRVIGIRDISSHVEAVKGLAINNDQQGLRLAWLNKNAAILKVGAQSESELSYVSKKARDAASAVHLALKDGVVTGGGKALINSARTLPDTEAGNILKSALIAPIAQILRNAGEDGPTTIQTYLTGLEGPHGYDAKNCLPVDDLFAAGIIDPALVVKNAVRNAVSIASTTITNRGIITLPRDTNNANTQALPEVRR